MWRPLGVKVCQPRELDKVVGGRSRGQRHALNHYPQAVVVEPLTVRLADFY